MRLIDPASECLLPSQGPFPEENLLGLKLPCELRGLGSDDEFDFDFQFEFEVRATSADTAYVST
jgi:hypothetical protein